MSEDSSALKHSSKSGYKTSHNQNPVISSTLGYCTIVMLLDVSPSLKQTSLHMLTQYAKPDDTSSRWLQCCHFVFKYTVQAGRI